MGFDQNAAWVKDAIRRGLIPRNCVSPPFTAGDLAGVGKPDSPSAFCTQREVELLKTVSEAEFQQAVIGAARGWGWAVAHFRAVRVQRKTTGEVYYETPVAADGKGFPDLLMLRGPVIVAAELKVGKNKATDEQKAWLARFLAASRDGSVVARVWYPHDWPEIVAVLAGRPPGSSPSGPVARG